ncbi:hypothetical protein AOQ84DRAFT_333956 [Glonium stellatum]|uniref:Metallo-beta-lactamase domain-containing protein n=1 Tax=Glonium stellatum TaxID=574774 RepID=A0A8E2F8Q5_9PEZI|nr:hypothetical protein AOQ84DRAFT_333956 [Glonium stellatum]
MEEQISCSALPDTPWVANLDCLDGGSFVASTALLHADSKAEDIRLYNWAFHVHDVKTDRHILWDLGLSGDLSCYATSAAKVMEVVGVVGPGEPICQQLARKGVLPHKIESVIFSHAHWDHCRPIKHEFPNAIPIFGPGTKDYCAPGHFQDQSSIWDGRFFDPEKQTENVEELKGPWTRFGTFEKAMDFFGTGSFWVIQAPGHMPGNLAAAAKLTNGEWVVLASDCCHSRELFDGTKKFAVWSGAKGTEESLHVDIPVALNTLDRLRMLESRLGAHIVLAHDTLWMLNEENKTLQSIMDDKLKLAARTRIPLGECA